jgi:glycosyltransferase involved in cell wall biosynthesis
MKKKLAIVSTHPIQYNAPFFALLAKSSHIEPKVFYTWSQGQEKVMDKKFGKDIKWDIPLLEDYQYEFVQNDSDKPDLHSFKGIVNPDLIPLIQSWGADAILVYGWNLSSHFKVMKHFKGKIPVFFRGDSTLIGEQAGIKRILRRIVLRYIYRFIDYALYVGANNKQYFIKHGVKEKNLFFAPHAIDNNRFYDHDGEYKISAQDIRKSHGISMDNVLFTYVGKFIPVKNLVFFLKEAVKLSGEQASFLFVGNGELEDEMKGIAKDHANIHFMPFQNQSQMPVIYYLSDVICLPSISETWGLVINEAMSCERAVLATNKVGCAVDLIQNGRNGYIFKDGDAEELKRCLEILSKDKNKIREMGIQSRLMIQDWSYMDTVKGLERAFSEVFKSSNAD